MLHPSDIVAAKLLVQLGDARADQLQRELAAVDADPQGAVDLVARLARAGALDAPRVTRIRRYVALFEHVRREAIYLRMVEKHAPPLSTEAISERLARIERSDYRTHVAAVLVEQGALDVKQARELDRKTHQAMRREDLKVLERYRGQRFEGVGRPLVREERLHTQVFKVSTLFRSRETLARVKRAIVRLTEEEGAPPREAQFEFVPAELEGSSEEVALDPDRRRQLEQMDTARLKAPEPPPEEEEAEAGDLRDLHAIGPYQVVECIGQGGMGAVFLAQEEGVGPIVAVKVLLTDRASADDVARFRREARISSLLRHPNAVTLIDEGVTSDGLSYMVIPFYAGKDLKSVLEASGPLHPEEAFHYFEQLLAGLEAVHQAGVVHRDLKPENVFVLAGSDREVRIVDLGIARLMDDDLPAADRAFRTKAGVVSGTPAYIAPESVTDDPIDGRTDIYSAGIMLYEMLTGRNPLYAETPYDYLREHLVGVPLTLFQGRKDKSWHPDLEALVAKMLAKEKADRPPSCQAILHLLQGGLREAAVAQFEQPPVAPSPDGSGLFNSFFKMFK